MTSRVSGTATATAVTDQTDGQQHLEQRDAVLPHGHAPRDLRHDRRAPAPRTGAAPRYCRAAGVFSPTVTRSRSLRKLFSPMPLMCISSSIFLKPPFFSRCSTMS
jgi:hypothetical protein